MRPDVPASQKLARFTVLPVIGRCVFAPVTSPALLIIRKQGRTRTVKSKSVLVKESSWGMANPTKPVKEEGFRVPCTRAADAEEVSPFRLETETMAKGLSGDTKKY